MKIHGPCLLNIAGLTFEARDVTIDLEANAVQDFTPLHGFAAFAPTDATTDPAIWANVVNLFLSGDERCLVE